MKNFLTFAACLFALLLSAATPANAFRHAASVATFAPTATVVAQPAATTVTVADLAAALVQRANQSHLNEGEYIRAKQAQRAAAQQAASTQALTKLSPQQKQRLARRVARRTVKADSLLTIFNLPEDRD
jgi:hypothetical protein